MGSTDPSRPSALLDHVHGFVAVSIVRAAGNDTGGVVGALRSFAGTARVQPHAAASIFSGLSPSALGEAITKALLGGLYSSLLSWVASGAASLVGVLADALSSTTEPVLTGSAFSSEFELMAALSAAIALPLVAVAAIQAIIRQEPGGLLRSVLVRLPLALLFTGVSVQLVALGLVATDQASALLIGAAGDPTHRMLTGLVTGLEQPRGLGLAAFGGFLVVLSAAVVAFVLWLELAVRSAAIAAASLFLPLALVGLAWPATSHWARRLGETLTALVLSKLVIAAVLALAAGLLVSPSGVAGVVEAVALLGVAAFAPFALLKLVPAVEAGAVAHLEGLGRRPVQAVERLGREVGLDGGGVAALAGLGGLMAQGGEAGNGSAQQTGNIIDGTWTAGRPRYGELGGGTVGSPPLQDPAGPTSFPDLAAPTSFPDLAAPASSPTPAGLADSRTSTGPPASSAPGFVPAGLADSPTSAGLAGPDAAQVLPPALQPERDQPDHD